MVFMILGGVEECTNKVIQEMDRNVIDTFEESPVYLHAVLCFDLYKIKLCMEFIKNRHDF